MDPAPAEPRAMSRAVRPGRRARREPARESRPVDSRRPEPSKASQPVDLNAAENFQRPILERICPWVSFNVGPQGPLLEVLEFFDFGAEGLEEEVDETHELGGPVARADAKAAHVLLQVGRSLPGVTDGPAIEREESL